MPSAHSHSISQGGVVAIILVVAALITTLLFVLKPAAKREPAPYEPPPVSYIEAESASVKIPVTSQGTIEPRLEIELSVEVPGRISDISPELNDGEFFEKGDVLARIDDSDYRLAIDKAQAQVAAARQALARVEAEAGQVRLDIQRMGRDPSKSSDFALRKPHLKEARANLKAAKADLAIAQLQLKRTRVRAPFDGRVIEKHVDVGEYLSPGMGVARIYSSRQMQVRLPLTQSQLQRVKLPDRQDDNGNPGSRVLLTADYAGAQLKWQARLTGVESMVDPRSRMLNAIVELDVDTLEPPGTRMAPTPGLFVRARIEGRSIDDVFVIPRKALRNGNETWLLKDGRLDIRKVSVLHKDDERAYVDQGLTDGDRVIVSALDYAIQDMELSVMEPR